jgi:LysM repeat protein
MRGVVVFVVGLLVLLGVGIPSAAQDGPPPVETVVGYYEEENPRSLGEMLYRWNVCFERFVTLNPELEFDNIPYGTRVLLPKDEPCYDYGDSGLKHLRDGTPRLKYFENGKWLAEPYYSSEVIYSNFRNIESILHYHDLCRDDLLAENGAIQMYGDRFLAVSGTLADVFLSDESAPCDESPSSDWLIIQRRASSFLPTDVTDEFNVCPEELPGIWFALYDSSRNDEVEFRIPRSAPPCYNESGQRLIYFDIDGKPLDEPEYSDLQVYHLQPGETLPDIATKYGVCLIDLIRLNYFPDWPIVQGEIEIFIPETRPCLKLYSYIGLPADSRDSKALSITLNICYEELAALNPHLGLSVYPLMGQKSMPLTYRRSGSMPSLFVDEGMKQCYLTYKPQRGESIYEIERALNICHESFLGLSFSDGGRLISNDETVLYFRRDTPPCYNAQGQRLYYESAIKGLSFDYYFYRNLYKAELESTAEYTEMGVHIYERADTVYSVSQKYNVCVHEVLAINPVLKFWMPEGYPTFVPDTRTCYDEATGMPLIYEDENGVLLDEPRVGDQLIYYGAQGFSRISYYYNVCQNRIEGANEAKLAGEAHYLGWIIPHDRPPCYDEDGYAIDYTVKQHEDSGGIVHTVQMGETLSGIAARYDKSIYWIADANNLSSVDMIWTEQRLIIPGGVTTRDVKLISAALLGLAAVGAIVMWRRNLTPRPPLLPPAAE